MSHLDMVYQEDGLPMDDSENVDFDMSSQFSENNLPETPRVVYQCDICNKTFNSVKGLQQHAVMHTDLKPFGCDVCGKSFRFKSNLFEHRSMHTNTSHHVCPFCGKTCRLKGNLKKHIKTHVNTKEELDEAWKPFSSNRRPTAELPEDAIIVRGSADHIYSPVSRPRKRKLGLGEDSQTWIDKIRRGEIFPYANINEKMRRLADLLMKDVDKMQSLDDLFEQARAVPFERFDCPLCKSVFMSRMDCAEHIEVEHPMARVERPLFCEVCLKTFADRKSVEQHESYHMRVHMLIENGDIRPEDPEILLPSSQVIDDDESYPVQNM